MIRYKVNGAEGYTVVPVECPEVGYPKRDINGDIQYLNTHFDTLDAAYQCAINNLEASVSLGLASTPTHPLPEPQPRKWCLAEQTPGAPNTYVCSLRSGHDGLHDANGLRQWSTPEPLTETRNEG